MALLYLRSFFLRPRLAILILLAGVRAGQSSMRAVVRSPRPTQSAHCRPALPRRAVQEYLPSARLRLASAVLAKAVSDPAASVSGQAAHSGSQESAPEVHRADRASGLGFVPEDLGSGPGFVLGDRASGLGFVLGDRQGRYRVGRESGPEAHRGRYRAGRRPRLELRRAGRRPRRELRRAGRPRRLALRRGAQCSLRPGPHQATGRCWQALTGLHCRESRCSAASSTGRRARWRCSPRYRHRHRQPPRRGLERAAGRQQGMVAGERPRRSLRQAQWWRSRPAQRRCRLSLGSMDV